MRFLRRYGTAVLPVRRVSPAWLRSNARFLLASCLAVAAAIGIRPAGAHVAFPPRAVFIQRQHPGFPLDAFAAGRADVLQPTWARSYLVIAYRQMMDPPIPEPQRAASIALWNERLRRTGELLDIDAAIREWHAERARVPGLPLTEDVRPYVFTNAGRETAWGHGMLNCPEDAFRHATAGLRERIRRDGPTNPQVRRWVLAQDSVFANCARVDSTARTPSRSAADADADADYQAAAASFYAGNYDDAIARFEAIAKDSRSPHKTIAPYLVARAWIRKGTAPPEPGAVDSTALRRALAQLDRVLADRKLAETHAWARALRSFVLFRIDPARRLSDITRELIEPSDPKVFRAALEDLTLLFDKVLGANEWASPQFDPANRLALRDSMRAHDLSDWLLTFQDPSEEARQHAVAQWREVGTLPWLLAALSKVDPGDPEADEMITAATAYPAVSAGEMTVTAHRLRLMIGRSRAADARAQLDRLLATRRAELPVSTVNVLLSLRGRAAADLDDFLAVAARPVAGTQDLDFWRDSKEYWQAYPEVWKQMSQPQLADDAARVMNFALPLATLERAATIDRLPARARRAVAWSDWTRAFLLDREDVMRSLAPTLQGFEPGLRSELARWTSAASAGERRFAAAMILLRRPGARPYVDPGFGRWTAFDRIDDLRDNWWCHPWQATHPDDADRPLLGWDPPFGRVDSLAEAQAPAFVTTADRDTAHAEHARLATLDSGSIVLAKIALEWAKAHPRDPLAPEALHRAVRAMRYGCQGREKYGPYSREAFQLLHQRYPKSVWAKRTPKWFE